MKILIISDMHSNPVALRAIMKAEGHADKIYFAGDFVDYGPDPAGAIGLARSLGIAGVSGNHDRRLVRVFDSDEYLGSNTTGRMDSVYGPVNSDAPNLRWVDLNCGRAAGGITGSVSSAEAGPDSVSEADQVHLTSVSKAGQVTLSSVSKADVDFLRALPETLSFTADGIAYLMSHQYDDGYGTIQTRYHFDRFWDEHFDLPGCAGMPRRMIFGHTHRQLITRISGSSTWMNYCSEDSRRMSHSSEERLWINPGSISYRRPDDPSKDAFYITITEGVIEMKHTAYEKRSLYDAVLAARPLLHPDELRVAEFFFCKPEADGPDHQWLEFLDGIIKSRK